MDWVWRGMDFDWGWHCRSRISPRERFLLRTHAEKPDLRCSICCAAGLCGSWVPFADESPGSFPYARVGEVGRAIHAGRIRGKFWAELERPRGERILSVDGMDSCFQLRVGSWFFVDAVCGRRESNFFQTVRPSSSFADCCWDHGIR